MVTEPGAHSRACGWRQHDHGLPCHRNCPTCGGRDVPMAAPTPAPTPVTEEVRPCRWHAERCEVPTALCLLDCPALVVAPLAADAPHPPPARCIHGTPWGENCRACAVMFTGTGIAYRPEPVEGEVLDGSLAQLRAELIDGTGSHRCPVCNTGGPTVGVLPDGRPCPLCDGWGSL